MGRTLHSGIAVRITISQKKYDSYGDKFEISIDKP